ncbi:MULTISPECIES: hypothetical protein [Clostridium]|uniref:Uncharacterized protein n=1 Tax=Clostridium carnis TaxID=1530 RepID=A0ABY6ST81_9CLOT|nr:hypothetical protein [Clostridium carnis]CAI3661592.1 conserved hypothetical protein [Clostridium neonatale]CAI3662129.1 conserved hypothetical protein [Clostridium neonatale]CAI3682411.1 conserved hypothetical protein [Clostridium neonatale]CAI3693905.1 conserved hypothetical protein [Clostridium neonatale]CAI3706381.1 conserved hypothetical protein [Clostridium neonatale]
MNQVKTIPTKLEIKEFIITFEYQTRKGDRREQQRKIKHFTKEDAKEILNNWLNTAERNRSMANVKILGIDEIKENKQEIVL